MLLIRKAIESGTEICLGQKGLESKGVGCFSDKREACMVANGEKLET